ncbi:hypothetical protein OPV22_034152 [Ensete ventricosum]|uniref:Uncharacterized protein n=1 Tax=Ensete ventricosum TaxID=4639 RepID=A0AAV8P408_ENSVE|nr:hypothetical protein OPV22_034152 [Ensete ventricosum]
MSKEVEEGSSTSVSFGFGNHPCSLLVYIVRACARCLGCSVSSGGGAQDPSAGDQPNDKDPAEDGSGVETSAARRPRRPPPSEGRGGQIN